MIGLADVIQSKSPLGLVVGGKSWSSIVFPGMKTEVVRNFRFRVLPSADGEIVMTAAAKTRK